MNMPKKARLFCFMPSPIIAIIIGYACQFIREWNQMKLVDKLFNRSTHLRASYENIQNVTIYFSYSFETIHSFPHIKKLGIYPIGHPVWFDDMKFISLTSLCTSLTNLDMSNCKGLEPDTLLSLMQLTKLTHLNMSYCDSVTDDTLLNLIPLPLIQLRIAGCYNITSKGIISLSKIITLESLYAGDSNRNDITDESLSALSTLNLKMLNLRGINNVIGYGIMRLHSLEGLHININLFNDDRLIALSTLTKLKTLSIFLSEYVTPFIITLKSLDILIQASESNGFTLDLNNIYPRLL